MSDAYDNACNCDWNFFRECFYQEGDLSYALNYKVYEWKTIFNESFISDRIK